MTHKESDRHFLQPDEHLFPQVTNDALADVGHEIVLAEVTGSLQHETPTMRIHKHGGVFDEDIVKRRFTRDASTWSARNPDQQIPTWDKLAPKA
jgi:hypothetical protein